MAAAHQRSPTYGYARRARTAARARARIGSCSAEAMTLVKDGRVPSVAEVGDAHRRVARDRLPLFPEPQQAHQRGDQRGPGAGAQHRDRGTDGPQRLRELFEKTFPLFKENERHMRAALLLALEHEGLERAGLLEEEMFRRGHRCGILRRAAAPMRAELGAAGFERLLKALSVIYGIEIYVVLKDIWGAPDREIEALARWMLDAIVSAALRDARGTAAPEKQKAARNGGPPRTRVRAAASSS